VSLINLQNGRGKYRKERSERSADKAS